MRGIYVVVKRSRYWDTASRSTPSIYLTSHSNSFIRRCAGTFKYEEGRGKGFLVGKYKDYKGVVSKKVSPCFVCRMMHQMVSFPI